MTRRSCTGKLAAVASGSALKSMTSEYPNVAVGNPFEPGNYSSKLQKCYGNWIKTNAKLFIKVHNRSFLFFRVWISGRSCEELFERWTYASEPSAQGGPVRLQGKRNRRRAGTFLRPASHRAGGRRRRWPRWRWPLKSTVECCTAAKSSAQNLEIECAPMRKGVNERWRVEFGPSCDHARAALPCARRGPAHQVRTAARQNRTRHAQSRTDRTLYLHWIPRR